MKNRVFVLICFLFVIPVLLTGQDLHFSQFFNSPLSTNPANTGFLPASDYRAGAHYRNQWSSVMSLPYRTFSVFGDAQIFRDKIDNGWLGVGALLLGDVAGSGSLRSSKLYASLAYHQMLGNSSLLSAGFNVGWANKRIDISELKFPDQFDGVFFDSNMPTSVALTNTGVSYFDLQAGINYAYFPTSEIYVNAGYSIHHVNQPKETFFDPKTADGRISMRHIGFLNALLKVNDRIILNPGVYYTNQAGAFELNGGMTAFYNLSEFGEKQIFAGLFYRNADAVIPMMGLEINSLRFTFSYDATLSPLRNFNNMKGAGELSIIKSGFYPTSGVRDVMCPHF